MSDLAPHNHASPGTHAPASGGHTANLGVFRLVTTVITLIIGGGVFTLAGDQAAGGASGAAILTAWGIAGAGVLCLVLSFYALSRLKPQLKGGIYSYANAGFGEFVGFCSAWGYWISALLATVSFCPLLFGALSYFLPVFGEGTNLPSFIGATCVVWVYAFLVSRGIREVTGVNAVITISKVMPIVVMIVAILLLRKFDPAVFAANLAMGAVPDLPFWSQVGSVMMLTIWVFVGIEGAVAISGRARRERDVGRATVIAFLCVLVIYLAVSVLSMGVMPLEQLAQLSNPAMAGVMEHVAGPWGAALVNGGVVLSLAGAMLGYTVLASESPYEAARQGVFVRAFTRTNKRGAPVVTLVVTGLIVQAFLVLMLVSDGTYQFFYTLSAGMILLPYLLSAAYFAKLTLTERSLFGEGLRGSPLLWLVVALVGVAYSVFIAYASGPSVVMTMSLLYAPGVAVYVVGKRERGAPYLVHPYEKLLAALLVVVAAAALVLLGTGTMAL